VHDWVHDMILRITPLAALLALLIFPGVLAAESDDLLNRIWDGVQQAQKKYTSFSGRLPKPAPRA